MSTLLATHTIRPTKDVSLFSDFPTGNFNGAGLRTGCTAGPNARRALFHFDLLSMPEYTSIDAAQLHLYCTLDGLLDVEAYVYRITQTAWVEGAATWNRYNALSSWATPGGDYDVATPTPVQWFQPSTAINPLTITLLRDFVVDALDNRAGQLHMLLKQADEALAFGEYKYNDREIEDLAGGPYPELLITFTRPSEERIVDDPRATIGAARVGGVAPAASPARASSADRPAQPG